MAATSYGDIERALLQLIPRQLSAILGVKVQRLADEDYACTISEDQGYRASRPRFLVGDSEEPLLLLRAIDEVKRLSAATVNE